MADMRQTRRFGDSPTDRNNNSPALIAATIDRAQAHSSAGSAPTPMTANAAPATTDTPARGFNPGVEITRELIAANPDAALEHIHALIEQGLQSSTMISDLQTRLGEADGVRHELERRVQEQAEAENRAANAEGENTDLRNQLADSHAQRTSLLTGQEEALKAYRDLILQHNPQLPPSLISGGTLGEINASVEAARGVVEHVQSAIQSSNNNSRMPAGAPMRQVTVNPATMTPTEKILYGIREQRGEEMTG
jgi:hypothetical protein